jgi:DNA topoisomerase IA
MFNEITKNAIQDAFKEPKQVNRDLWTPNRHANP